MDYFIILLFLKDYIKIMIKYNHQDYFQKMLLNKNKLLVVKIKKNKKKYLIEIKVIIQLKLIKVVKFVVFVKKIRKKKVDLNVKNVVKLILNKLLYVLIILNNFIVIFLNIYQKESKKVHIKIKLNNLNQQKYNVNKNFLKNKYK